MRELEYTTFISKNRASFNLWWKENLVKHEKVPKYYKTDFLQNFLFFFMFLLTTKFVKNSHFWGIGFFIFLQNVLKETWISFYTKFAPQWNHQKSGYQVREVLELFCHLIALIIALKSIEGRIVSKKLKEISF